MTPNKFAMPCQKCGHQIEPGDGTVWRVGRQWVGTHRECPSGEVVDPFADFVADKYQKKIPAALTDSDDNILIEAKAGSGKTTSTCWSLTRVNGTLGNNVAFMAFGTKDAGRLKGMLANHADASTYHSFGFTALKEQYPFLRKVNFGKTETLLDEFVGTEECHQKMRKWVSAIIDKAKADAVRPGDLDALLETCRSYDISLSDGNLEEAAGITLKVLEAATDVRKHGVDFNDMLWLPVVLDLELPEYTFLGIDEVQDLNQCQLEMTKRLIKAGARVMAVGDPNQSLYRFRGARSDSFQRVRALLSGTGRALQELPLPICYRCSKAVIAHAQKFVPGIQARPGAPEGLVDLNKNFHTMMAEVRPGDAIIARTNAPVVRIAYKMVDSGKPFVIMGGQKELLGLMYLIDSLSNDGNNDLAVFSTRLDNWLQDNKGTIQNPWWLDIYESRAEVLGVICQRCEDVKSLKREVRQLFATPNVTSDKIMISTIHRMKGGQAERVFLVEPHNVPHPRATTTDELEQESNAMYVVITRAKLEYYEVPGKVVDWLSQEQEEMAA